MHENLIRLRDEALSDLGSATDADALEAWRVRYLSRKGGAYQFDGWARIAPTNVPVYNPAFDVTPAKYVTAIITERGIAQGDYETSLALLCMGSGALHELTARE